MDDRKTCLIVEDEFLEAEALAIQLTSLGVKVLGHARNASDAVRRALELRPDLVFMDVRLGAGADGLFAAFAIAREITARTIFVTGTPQARKLQEVYADQPLHLLIKPYSLEELRAVVLAA